LRDSTALKPCDCQLRNHGKRETPWNSNEKTKSQFNKWKNIVHDSNGTPQPIELARSPSLLMGSSENGIPVPSIPCVCFIIMSISYDNLLVLYSITHDFPLDKYCPPVIKHGSWTKIDGRIRDALGFIIAMFDYQIWLVFEPPLWKNMKVSRDDYSHLNGKIIQMFQTTNQKWYIPD
jgi:hypothetical protein